MRHKMNIVLMFCCFCLPLLACGPLGDALLYNEWNRTGCSGFPSRAEVESVLDEHQELVQRLEELGIAEGAIYEAARVARLVQHLEDGTLDELSVITNPIPVQGFSVFVSIGSCPGGSFIAISYTGASQKEQILNIFDEAGAREEGPRMFFGIPFLLENV